VREIIAYARDRGIRVMLSLIFPATARVGWSAIRKWVALPAPYKIERGAGIFEPALDPTREQTYKFLDTFLGEMAALFPDAYMHIGGDERGQTVGPQSANPGLHERERHQDNHALQAYLQSTRLENSTKHGKK